MYTIKALDFEIYEAPVNDSLNWSPDERSKASLENDNYKCNCCGLISRAHHDYKSGYMELVSLKGVSRVLCSMCAQSQYLRRSVNGEKKHGLIVYCPNLTQGEIIKLAQWSYIAKYRRNKYDKQADEIIKMIERDLVNPVSNIIPGFTSGDVQEFSDVFDWMSPKLRSDSEKLFSNLKYWPNEIAFEKQTKFWNVAAFNKLADDLEYLQPVSPRPRE